MMTKRKMLAALLAGLITLSLAGCGADKTENTGSDPASTESGITATVTDSTAEPTAESSLPAGTESTTDSTTEKEQESSTAPADSGKPQSLRIPNRRLRHQSRPNPQRQQNRPNRLSRRRSQSHRKPNRPSRPRNPPNRSPPSLLPQSGRKASPKPTIHALCPRLRLMRKAIPPKASPLNGQRNWRSDGMSVGWERRESAVTVLTGLSAP